jgi:uncharacterized membrane protein
MNNAPDKELTKLITRGLVSLYMIYLAVKLFGSGELSCKGFLFTIIGAIFLLVGVAFICYSIRSFIVSRKPKTEVDKEKV